jgi:L-lactate dehydrogenase complex protein LldG
MSKLQSNPAKAAILGKIRTALKTTGDRSIEGEEVTLRLSQKERGILPARSQGLDREGLITLFLDYSEKVSTSTARLASHDDVPEAIADYLRARNLPQRVRLGTDSRLVSIDWDKTPGLERLTGPSDGHDPVGLSHALGGVAETGTAILLSGPDNPTTLNFLPETHIILVNGDDIEADYESLLDRLRNEAGEMVMPRVINMITGPSRSGDIEQTILLGAHGPRAVHILVVG